LELGDRDVARNAFQSQVSRPRDRKLLLHSGTDVLWETPNDVEARSIINNDENGALAKTAAKDKKALTTADSYRSEHSLDSPPPYSPQAKDSASTPAQTASSLSPQLSNFASNTSTNMHSSATSDSEAIRVHTNGSDLKSGFPYHPALFDLRIRPDEWERFTHEVVETTKFGIGDHAKLWASAASVALTGAVGTSVWVGKTMSRSMQEKKVKSGLEDMSDGGLGDTLQQWNSTYFKDLGVFAHLELSEHATKRSSEKSKLSKRLGSSKEERERKKEERKFVIVMTRLDDEGVPVEALHELDATCDVVEMPVPPDARTFAVELPGDERSMPVELPASLAGADVKTPSPLGFIAELPA